MTKSSPSEKRGRARRFFFFFGGGGGRSDLPQTPSAHPPQPARTSIHSQNFGVSAASVVMFFYIELTGILGVRVHNSRYACSSYLRAKQPSALSRTLSRALNMTVTTVIAVRSSEASSSVSLDHPKNVKNNRTGETFKNNRGTTKKKTKKNRSSRGDVSSLDLSDLLASG